MNGEAESHGGIDPIPLPDHLRGRKLWKYGTNSMYIDGQKPDARVGDLIGVVDDLWPVLTPEQQRAVIMASLALPYMTQPRRRWVEEDITHNVRLWGDGDIRVITTPEQSRWLAQLLKLPEVAV